MKLFLSSVSLCAFLVPALALPSASAQHDHVVLERRAISDSNWLLGDQLNPYHVVPARVGLTQSNLEQGEKYL